MFKDIKIIKNTNFRDKRGLLWTTWKKGFFKKIKFNHDKFSLSKRKTIRGLHCDFKSWKMVTSVYGRFMFIVVDMRKKSKNYLKYKKWILDHKKPKIILVPPHYANAHLCLSDFCIFHYKWSYKGKYVDAKSQKSYRWNDPKIKINWPIKKPILSLRDKKSKLI
ncbi:MAG: dTDP-4-dehydrorhamnose 3,5-epimerase [Candidatus Pelagibacter sp.]|jgi:dTDP-4-dehydrorhamnose 3,5-epimerase|nr:dTDP-4-dehydrorhamnose 3,5-epimerase [Candidatus Pelagibacter sp.]|tara:strand:- start:257 stop:748 length:492 start_codon:yes stop_codon:yes gene_type:complete